LLRHGRRYLKECSKHGWCSAEGGLPL
jgi:hypothetical protein